MDGSSEDRRPPVRAVGEPTAIDHAGAPELPRLHVLVSEVQLEASGGLPTIERVLERVAPIALHLRARLSARALFDTAERLASTARATGNWLVVNGRPDIALAVGASAVQLGGMALGVVDVRRLVVASGGALRIGASIHRPEEAEPAVRGGADYLVLGTIYETRSHPGRKGSGPTQVSRVSQGLPEGFQRPVLAIGGLDAERVREVVSAGAHGIVVSRAVWAARDPVAAAGSLSAILAQLAQGSGSTEVGADDG